jgi:hypothetical protein
VAIEVDSRQWHASPADWERTMSRHGDLGQCGIVTLHVTPHQLRADPGPARCHHPARRRVTGRPAAWLAGLGWGYLAHWVTVMVVVCLAPYWST